MQTESVDTNKIKNNGWKQGACLLVTESTKIYPYTQELPLPSGLYVLLSHDCDILNSSQQKEPVVELIHAKEITKCINEFTSGKNPRQLHIDIIQGKHHLEFLPHNRLFITRKYLEIHPANKIEITEKQLKILTLWISKRYRRSAFPDVFNKRCKPIVNNIKQIFNGAIKDTYGLFIYLSTEKELEPNETYKIIIRLLVPKDIYDNQEELLKIQDDFEKILILFNSIHGIKVLVNSQNIGGSQVQSDDDLTVYSWRKFKQWDFDYISFLNDENGKTVNDII